MHRVSFPYSLVLLSLAVGCGTAPDLETVRRFQAAEQSFATADGADEYLQAAGQYQQLIDAGLESPLLFYNQGNAWLNAHKYGHAIAAYRQAQRYRPSSRDPQLHANLQQALKLVGQPPDNPGIADRLFFWQTWLGYRDSFVVTTGLVILPLLLLTVFRWRGSVPSVVSRTAFALGIVACAIGTSAVRDWYRYDQIQHGVIVVDQTVARKGHAVSFADAFNQPLTEGTEFVVVERNGSWLHIRIPATGEGWIEHHAAVVY